MLEARIADGIVGTNPPVKILPIVLSDVTDIKFTGIPFDHTKYARAFVPYQTGTIRLVFPDGSTYDKPVVANTKYVITVRRFNSTGTVTVTSGEMHN